MQHSQLQRLSKTDEWRVAAFWMDGDATCTNAGQITNGQTTQRRASQKPGTTHSVKVKVLGDSDVNVRVSCRTSWHPGRESRPSGTALVLRCPIGASEIARSRPPVANFCEKCECWLLGWRQREKCEWMGNRGDAVVPSKGASLRASAWLPAGNAEGAIAVSRDHYILSRSLP